MIAAEELGLPAERIAIHYGDTDGTHYAPSSHASRITFEMGPATLQDSLMARLDRLAPVKEVAQMAACIGREFSHELLAAVASLGENALGDALAQLLAAELVFRRGAPPKVGYSFKHALVQDVAHQSLLKSRRRARKPSPRDERAEP